MLFCLLKCVLAVVSSCPVSRGSFLPIHPRDVFYVLLEPALDLDGCVTLPYLVSFGCVPWFCLPGEDALTTEMEGTVTDGALGPAIGALTATTAGNAIARATAGDLGVLVGMPRP